MQPGFGLRPGHGSHGQISTLFEFENEEDDAVAQIGHAPRVVGDDVRIALVSHVRPRPSLGSVGEQHCPGEGWRNHFIGSQDTPLAAVRCRRESVENPASRAGQPGHVQRCGNLRVGLRFPVFRQCLADAAHQRYNDCDSCEFSHVFSLVSRSWG